MRAFAIARARVGDAVRAVGGPAGAGHHASGALAAAHAQRVVVPVLGRPRISDREAALPGRAMRGDDWCGVVPGVYAECVLAQRYFGDDAEVAQVAVDHRKLVQRAPVLAGGHERQAHPGLPLQRRHPVHRAGHRVARQRQRADDLADAAEPVLARSVDERRDRLHVARDQQRALAALREPADHPAIVRVEVDAVAVGAEQRDDLVEQPSSAREDARHVLEQHDRDRIVLVGFKREPHAAQREPVERLVLGGLRLGRGQQPAEALTRTGLEQAVDRAEDAADVRRTGLAPLARRLAAVEGGVLFAVEQVEHRAACAGQSLEVADCARIDIDAAGAHEAAFDAADAEAAFWKPIAPPPIPQNRWAWRISRIDVAAVRVMVRLLLHGLGPHPSPSSCRPCGSGQSASSPWMGRERVVPHRSSGQWP